MLGENLSRIRAARGMTQDELSLLSGVSGDTISRLERGARFTARRGTVDRLARALGVDPGRLLGLEVPEQDTTGADDLRRAVTALDFDFDFAENRDVLPIAELHELTGLAWSDYLAGRHAALLSGLPGLMVDTRRAVRSLADDHQAEAAGLLATSYRLTAGLAGRIGLVDLAAHAAHRALDAARHTSRPELDEAAALRYLAWVMVRQGDLDSAERLAVRAAERLDGGLMSRPEPDRVGVFGSLLMNAATAAARGGKVDRAEDLLSVARGAAVREGRDRIAEAGVFGPRVAAMQMVDQAVRVGDPERALRLADQVPDPAGPVPAFWEAGHLVHLAAAFADLGRWREVAEHLLAAGRTAPEWTRVQPLAQTVRGQLVEALPPRRSSVVAEVEALFSLSR